MTSQSVWQKSVSSSDARLCRRSVKEWLACTLECGFRRCPVLTLVGFMLFTGLGMLAAVTIFTLLAVIPIELLLGWFFQGGL